LRPEFPGRILIVDVFGAYWRNSGLPSSDFVQLRWNWIDIRSAGGVTINGWQIWGVTAHPYILLLVIFRGNDKLL
jgi:hypothetical protein